MKMKKLAVVSWAWAAIIGFIILIAFLLVADVPAQAATITRKKVNPAETELKEGLALVSMAGKAQDYASDTGYLILVDEAHYNCGIFTKDSNGSWKMLKAIPISIGKASTPTPIGEYTVQKKKLYFDLNGYRFWYMSSFGGFGIHSTAYEIADHPEIEKDARINAQASNGCIRVSLPNAKWVSDNVPVGTKAVIYNSAY